MTLKRRRARTGRRIIRAQTRLWWAPGRGAVGAREWLSVGQTHMLLSSQGRAPGCAEMGSCEWLPVGLEDMRMGS
jgi:hypothetical protein